MTEHRLIRIQAASGLAFATFLTLHLANTLSAIFGQHVYDAVQRTLRSYYQFPLVEIVCVAGAALVHIAAGVLRIRHRRRQPVYTPAPMRLRLHRWSGYYMMAAFAGHVTATRGPSLLLGLPVDFSFVSFSLIKWPGFFYPYYALFFASGFYHLLGGAITAIRVLRPGSLPHWRLPRPVAIAGAVAGLLAIFALGGWFYVVDQTRYAEIQALYDRFTPGIVRASGR